MNPHTQDVPGTYVWEVPGKSAAVHIPLTVVDRVSAEIMRGYGANPKRNPEVGGVLLGSVEQGSPTIFRIEDFAAVPCKYRLGPSYVFTDDDCEPFEQAATRADAIGYFRSHTREGLSLAIEDVELLDHFFAGRDTVALLIRPYATQASVGGFFIRENGSFPASTPLEFPFRRRELTGQVSSPGRAMTERRPRRSIVNQGVNQSTNRSVDQSVDRGVDRDTSPAAQPPSSPDPAGNGYASERGRQTTQRNPAPGKRNPAVETQPSDTVSQSLNPQAGPAYAASPAARSRMGSGWVWIPLSFLFLLFGMALGYEVALLNAGSRLMSSAANPAAEFSLSLAVSESGPNLSVHWDRQAPAVRASRRGVLEIEEGGITKPVELDAAQLQNGTLTYRHATSDVHFRLTVFPNDQTSVVQSAEWRQEKSAEAGPAAP